MFTIYIFIYILPFQKGLEVFIMKYVYNKGNEREIKPKQG